MQAIVLTFMGADRPGLVETISQIISAHGGNWLESRMAHLAGQFAGILLVGVPDAKADNLISALRDLDSRGLAIVVHRSDLNDTVDDYLRVELHLVGHDRSGIVHEVTQALASKSVNVEEFHSECVSAPMSGEKLFQARAQLRLPTGLSVDELRGHLEQITHDLMVDISLCDSVADSG